MKPRPPFRPTAVVFDLDGLLIDSEPAWARAERQVVAELGHDWDPRIPRLLFGRGPEDAARTLADHLDGHDPEEVGRLMLAAAEEQFLRGLEVRPGARALVEGLAPHVPLAVATNSRRVLARLSMTASGLGEAIRTVVTAEDVTAPKPAPDPYAVACARLGAEPDRSVAFEDSPVGVASAGAAGLWVVGCPSLPDTPLPGAHAVIASLTDVDPVVLLGIAKDADIREQRASPGR